MADFLAPSPSEKLAALVAESGKQLLASCEDTDQRIGQAVENGLRSAVRKINNSFDAEIEKLKGTFGSIVTEEEMFKQVQQEEMILARQTDLNRQRADFVNTQIVKNRKFCDAFKSAFETSNYQNLQNLTFLNNQKAVR